MNNTRVWVALRRIGRRLARSVRRRHSFLLHASDDAFIDFCFASLLRRSPDEADRAAYRRALDLGVHRLELLEHILRSDEFQARAAGGAESVPAGHFYSVIPSAETIDTHRQFDWDAAEVPGVDLRPEAQWALLERLRQLYPEQPYGDTAERGLRYRRDNPSFAPSDAVFLYLMMRELKPRRIIEVGCGWSSGVMLDANERAFDHRIRLTFIEPHPASLFAVMKPGDRERVTVIADQVQEVGPGLFDTLEANDILFIDSSHVSKLGSDVNYLVFEILPRLKPGVVVHVHDIFYPFEFPYEWLRLGRFWNEQYLLRAFLQFNTRFEVLLFSTMVIRRDPAWFRAHMPECLNTGGCLWLRRR